MLKQIALAALTAAALVASPSLGHASLVSNGMTLNGINVNGNNLNGVNVNGLWAPSWLSDLETADREVYVVGEQVGDESSTILTVELPRITR